MTAAIDLIDQIDDASGASATDSRLNTRERALFKAWQRVIRPKFQLMLTLIKPRLRSRRALQNSSRASSTTSPMNTTAADGRNASPTAIVAFGQRVNSPVEGAHCQLETFLIGVWQIADNERAAVQRRCRCKHLNSVKSSTTYPSALHRAVGSDTSARAALLKRQCFDF